MELGIGMAGKRHSNVVIILMNVVLTVLISDFIAFVIEWIRGGEIRGSFFFYCTYYYWHSSRDFVFVGSDFN
ncbi:hypothetical protein JGI13_01434 [Candidatus Kryptonium thompsonii]|uniref:hypothetical protein n=1 Tax=Candidatus Kryptonium thompsonii TaxID=1633631 RepID=UPI000708408D|nr:hypothetical protein [Candidatus Kryptonium thompsoni]CUS87333.1 hypothetical protein JGI13_01434 [Candidatus Kryptonium thompsoni]